MERKNLRKINGRNSNILIERESSKKFDGGYNRKLKVVRSWGQISTYLNYQPVIEHHTSHHWNICEIAFVVDGEVDILDERTFTRPNRRRKNKEV